MKARVEKSQHKGPVRFGLPFSFLLAVLLILVLSAEQAMATTRWSSFRPKKAAGKVCVHVGGKDVSYYKLDHKTPLQFTAHGPNKIRLMTRQLPVGERTKKRTYTLRVIRDGKEILKKMITANPSTTAILCDKVGQAVGVGKKSYVTVPRGKHIFQIYIEEKGSPVAVRLFKQKKIREITLLSFTPDEYNRVCTLVLSNGKEYLHYHFTRSQPLRFQVYGPTTLTIWTRVDFVKTMMTSTSYGLEVLRNGESQMIAHYDNVRKLTTAMYKEEECREIISGERKKITIEVPKGTWSYEMRPTQPGPEEVAARILIPKKDVIGSPDK